jgi:hypothetical protein
MLLLHSVYAIVPFTTLILTFVESLLYHHHTQVVSGATLCKWDKDAGCSITPPPASTTFVLLIAFIILMFMLPLDFCIGFVQEQYASKRPVLEEYGLTSDSWLGSVYHQRGRDDSPVTDALMRAASARGIKVDSISLGNDNDMTVAPTEMLEMGQIESDFVTRKQYDNFASPREELLRLLSEIERSATAYTNRADRKITRSTQSSSAHFSAMKAVRAKLMINSDGTLRPITFRQKLFYNSRQDMLENKIKNVRSKAAKICKKIGRMEVADGSFKDIALMRVFILENVSFFFRFSLRKCFDEIDGSPPENVNLLVWLLAWFIIGGCLLFFLYWIFAWGVKNGGDTLHDWGKDYGVAIVQDVFICEVVKIFILFVFAIISVRPQLQVIKRVINDCALSLLQDEVDLSEDVNVVHHFSPACRAACSSELSNLPSSAVLRKMTDADIENCKEHKHHTLGSITFYVLVAAAILATISEVLIDQLMDASISSVWLAFLLLNDKIFSISPVLIAALYASIGGLILYIIFVYVPSVQKARRLRKERMQASKEFRRRRSSSRKTGDNLSGKRSTLGKIAANFDWLMGIINTFFSRERSETVKEKARNNLLVWGGMNNPKVLQAQSGSERAARQDTFSFSNPTSEDTSSLSETQSRPKTLTRRKTFRLPNSAEIVLPTVFPERILRMRPTDRRATRGEDVNDSTDQLMAAKYFNAVPAVPSDEKHEPTISNMRLSQRSRLARIYLSNTEITFDPRVALRRMLLRQIIGTESYKRGVEMSALDNIDPLKSFLNDDDVVDLLTWVWDTFYPNMRELTGEQRNDTIEHYLKWRAADQLLAVRSITDSESTISTELSFAHFSSWFLALWSRINVGHSADGKELLDPLGIDTSTYYLFDQIADQLQYMGSTPTRRTSKRAKVPLSLAEMRLRSRLPRTTVFI